MTQNYTLRIDEEILNKIKVYAEIENITQTDFINELMDEALANYLLKRSGGMILTIPNPQFSYTDKINAAEEITKLLELYKSNCKSNLHLGLDAIANFCQQRLFRDNSAKRSEFRNSLIMDNK